MTTTFSGEIQLAGWSDTHNGGAKITFWLPDAESLEVFKGLTAKKGNTAGHRFMAALVEIGDDELPVELMEPGSSEFNKIVKPKGGALAKLAGQWCNLQSFFDWIQPVYDNFLGDIGPEIYDTKQEYCRHCLLVMCDIDSRAELDHDPIAAEKFHRLIRLPYSEYLKEAA